MLLLYSIFQKVTVCLLQYHSQLLLCHYCCEKKKMLILALVSNKSSYSCLPEWISLGGEQTEVFLSQLNRWQGLHLQVGPRLDEHHQAFKGVQAKAIVPIVGQMSHEDTNLLMSRKKIRVRYNKGDDGRIDSLKMSTTILTMTNRDY